SGLRSESSRGGDRSPGSVSHPWLAAAAHPCAALRNPRPGTTIAQSLASLRKDPTEASRPSRSKSCPGGRGSRQAKHGCFARESGQDVLTERKAIPRSTGATSVRSLDVAVPTLLPPASLEGERNLFIGERLQPRIPTDPPRTARPRSS